MASTYDLATPTGKLRLLIEDTDVADSIFSDEELEVFLHHSSSDLYAAAALAWMANAGSHSRLAKRKQIGKFSFDLTLVASECRNQAMVFKRWSEEAPAGDFIEIPSTAFARRDMKS